MFKLSFIGKHQLYDDDKPKDMYFATRAAAEKEAERHKESNYYWTRITEIQVIAS